MRRVRGWRSLRRDFLRDETASSMVETGLVLSLCTAMVLVIREMIAGPLLQKLVAAARVLERALG